MIPVLLIENLLFLEHSGCSSEWGVSCSSLQTLVWALTPDTRDTHDCIIHIIHMIHVVHVIHVIHMLHVIYMTWYTWYTWYIWFTRNTLSTCYTCPCTSASLLRVTLPVSRVKRSWLDCDYYFRSASLLRASHWPRSPAQAVLHRASLSSLLSPVSYEVARCNSPRYSEIGCPTTLITIILTIERQLCLWSLMKSFIVLDRDNQTFIHCADRNVIKRNEYNYQSYFYLIGLFRVIFFHKKGEDLLVKLLLHGSAGVAVGEELLASYTRCWNIVTIGLNVKKMIRFEQKIAKKWETDKLTI